jgi:hypothetical protein
VSIVGGTTAGGLLSAVNGDHFEGTRVLFRHPAAAGAQQ